MTFSTDLVDRELSPLREFRALEVRDLSPNQLHDASDSLGRARRALDALIVQIAGEVGRRSAPDLGVGGLSRREGYSTPQEFLAKTLGTSANEAKRMIDVGNVLEDDGSVSGLGEDGSGAGASAKEATESAVGPTAPRPKYPVLADAIASGKLGVEAAALVTRTLDAIRAAKESDAEESSLAGASTSELDEFWIEARAEVAELEIKLVAKAETLGLRDLRRLCDRERAWRTPKQLAAKERRHREARTLFFGEDADGMTVMTAKLDVASAAPVKAWIEAQVRHAFQQRRKDPHADGSDIVNLQVPGWDQMSEDQRARVRADFLADERTAGQIRVDALMSLAMHGLDCDAPTSGVKTAVELRVDLKSLEDDLALGECNQVNGPITVQTLRAMAVDAEVIPVVMGGVSMPLDVGRATRFFTKSQRIALNERDGGCSWCHAPPSYCHAHHIDWWARDRGKTDLNNGVLLCVSCHHRVHRDGWEISVRNDQVWFKPSDVDGRPRQERMGGRAHLELA